AAERVLLERPGDALGADGRAVLGRGGLHPGEFRALDGAVHGQHHLVGGGVDGPGGAGDGGVALERGHDAVQVVAAARDGLRDGSGGAHGPRGVRVGHGDDQLAALDVGAGALGAELVLQGRGDRGVVGGGRGGGGRRRARERGGGGGEGGCHHSGRRRGDGGDADAPVTDLHLCLQRGVWRTLVVHRRSSTSCKNRQWGRKTQRMTNSGRCGWHPDIGPVVRP